MFLHAKVNKSEIQVPIEMKLKKIGGDWKLDGDVFVPMDSLEELLKTEKD